LRVFLGGVGGGGGGAYAAALHALVLLPVVAAGLLFLWVINLSLAETLRRPARPSVALEGESSE